MNFIVDIIIIIAAIIAIYLGVSRGFIKSVMGFISLLLAVIATVIFTPPAAEYINERFVADKVSAIVSGAIEGILDKGLADLDFSTMLDDMPETLVKYAEQFGYDLNNIEIKLPDLESLTEGESIKTLADDITAPTAMAISNVISAIAIFVVAFLAIKLIMAIIEAVCHLPVLNSLNTLLGFIFGLLTALLLALLIGNAACALIKALEAINPTVFNDSVITDSIILKFMYENSLIITK